MSVRRFSAATSSVARLITRSRFFSTQPRKNVIPNKPVNNPSTQSNPSASANSASNSSSSSSSNSSSSSSSKDSAGWTPERRRALKLVTVAWPAMILTGLILYRRYYGTEEQKAQWKLYEQMMWDNAMANKKAEDEAAAKEKLAAEKK